MQVCNSIADASSIADGKVATNESHAVGYVHSFESFASVDGPGVRSCVFLQGCSMRCKYCHNPETWAIANPLELANPSALATEQVAKCSQTTQPAEYEKWTASDLLKKCLRYKPYWGKNGGITVSGGEALLQIDFVTEFFTLAHEKGINTTLDTSAQNFDLRDSQYMAKFEKLCSVTDLFLLDIKHIDDEKHKKLTGHTNKNILQAATYLSENAKKMWIRHVLVPGITDDENDLHSLRNFIDSLKTVERVEVLPYHTLGIFKWKNLGINYPLDKIPTPTHGQIEKAEKILCKSL